MEMKVKQLLIIFLSTLTTIVWADEGVDIDDPVQVSELNNIQGKLDSVSTAIMGCMDSGKEHKECICKHRGLIIEFNTNVKILFSNYPSFENLDIVRFKSPNGTWVSQSLKGIRAQASVEPTCT